jgi:hypothetical protein
MYFRLLGSERLSRPDEAQRTFASQNRDLTESAGDEIESLSAAPAYARWATGE